MLKKPTLRFITLILGVVLLSSPRCFFAQQSKPKVEAQTATLSNCEKPVVYRIEISPEGKVRYKMGQSSQTSLSLSEFARPFAACSESRKLIILLIGSVPVDSMFNLLDAAKKENLENVQVIAQDVQGNGAIEIHIGGRVPPVK
jgi:thioredoxin-related protein